MSSATDFYVKTFGAAEAHQNVTLTAGFQTKFLLDWVGGIDKFIQGVDRTDVIQDLSIKLSGVVLVRDWCPLKLDGLHSLHLEKAIRVRYSNYDSSGKSNVKNLYAAASAEASDLLQSVASFKQDITQWTSN